MRKVSFAATHSKILILQSALIERRYNPASAGLVLPGYERTNITGQHRARFGSEVGHVARRVEVQFGRTLLEACMRDEVVGRSKRRDQIVISCTDHQPQMRVSPHGNAEIGSVIGVGASGTRP